MIAEKDDSIDQFARNLLKILSLKVYLTKALQPYILSDLKVNKDRELMLWEDTYSSAR